MKAPRGIGDAMRDLRARTAPPGLLAATQAAWPRVAGERVAAQAQPVAERAGVVTVACRSATWAQELDLLQTELRRRLNRVAEVAAAGEIAGLRFTADAARHEDPAP